MNTTGARSVFSTVESLPIVLLDTLILLQATVDLSRFPATLVVADSGEFVGVALGAFDTAVSAVGAVGFAATIGVAISRGWGVPVDR
ncbi:hypothetical protein [Halorubrum ezzemoulense]|uniref:hypothetical protein n=1 Tax=Halorubrum ezzemoulense TaxID=337243 RepID=UPI00232F2E72|nr:hypothetical protein [Halorubrum ezzemoulense]MDB2248595.1 hypothetical protein [Halorubrum ezzemoulense]MDB2276133.1 hypothetical protein [Halorubrum ezzemoulense]